MEPETITIMSLSTFLTDMTDQKSAQRFVFARLLLFRGLPLPEFCCLELEGESLCMIHAVLVAMAMSCCCGSVDPLHLQRCRKLPDTTSEKIMPHPIIICTFVPR